MTRTRPDGTRRIVRRRAIRVFSPIVMALYLVGAAHATSLGSPGPRTGLAGRIATNDNRVAAGTLAGGVLTIRLDARAGEWQPDGPTDPWISVRAFGEEGKPLQIPAPLIRIPSGTEIRASVRNSLDTTLYVHGLYERGATGGDVLEVKPGEVREIRFKAGVPGTYFYWANTNATATLGTRGPDTQLSGAFVVDSAGTLGAPRDRVLVLGLWGRLATPGVVGPNDVLRFVINGKTWPNTERLTYTVGDSVRFRIVNTSSAPHPMHLHGFYYNVVTRGDERSDTAFAASSPHLAVTERVAPGRTMSFIWVPERAGNWMFHCHDNFHVLRNRPLDGTRLPAEQMLHVKNHALEMMGGLVMGIEVRPNGREVEAAPNDAPRRRLRLVARVDSGGTDDEPAFGYVLQNGTTTMPDHGPLLPGPTILLKRGEPVAITVVNELPEATAVHWHGIELESYFDGVAGFSGTPKKLSPAIAARDSFEARFTPPRAGTFIYHPHADEVRQQKAGLSGAIVVVDAPETYELEKDIVLLISTPRRAADGGTVLLNGTNTPLTREMRVGERYRLRVVNIHTARPSMIARVMRDSTALTWRPVAKDGRDLPQDQVSVRPAVQQLGNGETYDFEFVPSAPGDVKFTVSSAAGSLLVTMPIHVR